MHETDLHLHEEVLLLALDEEKGSIIADSWQLAAGGAIVAELLLRERVRLDGDRRPHVEVVDSTPVGDPILDDALAEMAAREKPRRGVDWVQRLQGRGSLKREIADGLLRKRIVREEEGKVLWIFPTTRYPERDGRAENEVRQRLSRAIFRTGEQVLPRTVVLLALCHAAGMLPQIFDKQRLKNRRDHIEKLVSGEAAGVIARQAAEAAQMALMVAVVVPTIVVTTTS
ncbi:hypothetical protein GF314_09755 [bacterium]|nr:hypothetical protein [bacterium]